MTPLQQHKQTWSKCTACELSQVRKNVVLFRGTVPCDVLFIGEAPGTSEDILARPFCGPAGKLLDDMVIKAHQAQLQCDDFEEWNNTPSLKTAFTNVIACIPKMDDGDGPLKVSDPPKQCVKACRPRLKEFVALCRPKLFVWVGRVAAKYAPDILADYDPDAASVEIHHPAFILRSPEAEQGLQIRKTILALTDAMESTFGSSQ